MTGKHPHTYIEGNQATENFEEGMKALFKVPKEKAVSLTKKQKRALSERKPKKSDKD